MSNFNEWGVSYSAIRFFSDALRGHGKVASFERERDILFKLTHENGDALNVLLLDEYSLGLAAVLRARSEFPEADYIVTAGNWNGYTREAKAFGRANNIGIFNVGEFFGALNWTEPKTFYRKDPHGNPVYSFKNP
jgi:hypothetical protein